MFNKKITLAAALLCGAALAAPSVAQDVDKSGTNFSDSPAELDAEGKAVEQLALGYRLADYARAAGDARAMIVAARLVGAVPLKAGTDKGALEGDNAGESGQAVPAVTGDDLYKEARALAKDDPDLVDAIDTAQSEGSKGVTGGAVATTQYVPGQTIWTVRFTADGGVPLLIATRRASGAEMDLKVFDENGNLVCQDLSHNVSLGCRVNPIWQGAFSVQVINHGNSGSSVAMVTN